MKLSEYLKEKTPPVSKRATGGITQKPSSSGAGRYQNRKAIAARPEFYLVYLLFYFVPWGFRAPGLIDIAAAIIAVSAFLPIHFRMFEKSTPKYIPLIFLTASIGFMVAPFNSAPGVFQIYASTQAGFQRPARHALYLLGVLTVIYVLATLLLGRTWFEIGFVIFLSLVSGLSCMASAEQRAQANLAEKSRSLEREQAALGERERIARDLHDLLGHTLTMVALKSDVADRLMASDPERARIEVREIRDAARTALKDVRAAVADMAVTTIADELNRAERALASAMINLSVVGDIPQLRRGPDTLIGLTIREAITNVIRHSTATTVDIVFEYPEGKCVIAIGDNGRGGDFVPGAGLSGVVQRIESLSGHVDVDGSDGTILTLTIPDTRIKPGNSSS